MDTSSDLTNGEFENQFVLMLFRSHSTISNDTRDDLRPKQYGRGVIIEYADAPLTGEIRKQALRGAQTNSTMPEVWHYEKFRHFRRTV